MVSTTRRDWRCVVLQGQAESQCGNIVAKAVASCTLLQGFLHGCENFGIGLGCRELLSLDRLSQVAELRFVERGFDVEIRGLGSIIDDLHRSCTRLPNALECSTTGAGEDGGYVETTALAVEGFLDVLPEITARQRVAQMAEMTEDVDDDGCVDGSSRRTQLRHGQGYASVLQSALGQS